MRQGRDPGKGNAGNPGLAIDSDGGEGQALLQAKFVKGGKGANGDRGSTAVSGKYVPQHNGAASHAAGAAAGGALSESWNMVLLVLLYMMQGVPLGLTTGAMPFMLQSKLTYTQVGVFGLASYPYSLKLLWSPIVDSCYSASFGRRKSWIVPVQLATAAMLVACAGLIQRLFDAADVNALTALFLVFVFLAATQVSFILRTCISTSRWLMAATQVHIVLCTCICTASRPVVAAQAVALLCTCISTAADGSSEPFCTC